MPAEAERYEIRDPERDVPREKGALKWALGITSVFLAVEVVGGMLTNSLALLADAGHMFTDVASLGLALLAMHLAARPTTPEKTYGYHRTEILAALLNGVTLLLISFYIFYRAFQRFQAPPEVKSLPMFVVASFGLSANVASGYVLSRSKGTSLNIRGAFLHVLADALGSVGAMAAGLIMLTTGWYLADPLISVLIGLLILFGAGRLVRDTVHVLMEGTPSRIALDALRAAMSAVPGVVDVHDLHVWTVTSGFEAMSGHVVVADASNANSAQKILRALRSLLRERFGIAHTTIQIEEQGMQEGEGGTACEGGNINTEQGRSEK